jgi:DNA polymerase elongation subunit (family B)
MENARYQPRKQARMFLDIETACNPETCTLMPEPVVSAPSNYKDPDKIAEYIRAETEKRRAEALDRAALDPDYGKILSIGFGFCDAVSVFINRDAFFPNGIDPETDPSLVVIAYPEKDLIKLFWQNFAACNGNCIGYNILGFDLPYLLRRSMALCVPVPFVPNLAKFRTEPVTDLMMILYNWGSQTYKGLKQVAKIYGLPNDCPDVDGSQVAGLDVETLTRYQASDVRLCMELYQRMNGIYFKH